MADLIELLLNLVLSLLEVFLDLGSGDGCAGWRFYFPFMTSVWIIVLIECLGSDSGGETVLCVPIILAGLATGIIWEVWNNRRH
jgi:hypothetical protein